MCLMEQLNFIPQLFPTEADQLNAVSDAFYDGASTDHLTTSMANIQVERQLQNVLVTNVPDNSIVTLHIDNHQADPRALESSVKRFHDEFEKKFPTCVFVVLLNVSGKNIFDVATEEQMNRVGWYRKQ